MARFNRVRPEFTKRRPHCLFPPEGNVTVYGGFAGGETDLSERDWATISQHPQRKDLRGTDYRFLPMARWTLYDSTFTGNSASSNGGVAYYGLSTITSCTFKSNVAGGEGGAYYGNWTVTNCTFDGSSATYDRDWKAMDCCRLPSSRFDRAHRLELAEGQ